MRTAVVTVLLTLVGAGCSPVAYATVDVTVSGLDQTRLAGLSPASVVMSLSMSPRTTIAPDAGDDARIVREAQWDGSDRFTFRVLVPVATWESERLDVTVETMCGSELRTAVAATKSTADRYEYHADVTYTLAFAVADVPDFAPCR